jgi:predicted RNase H-like nuclease (RuvC/YqgF family)
MDPFFMSAMCSGTGAIISQKNHELKQQEIYYRQQQRLTQENIDAINQLAYSLEEEKREIEYLRDELKREKDQLAYEIEVNKRKNVLENSINNSKESTIKNSKSAIEILKARLSNDEITEDQYYRLKKIIEAD